MVVDTEAVGGLLTIGGVLAGGVVWICKSMVVPLKETLEKLIHSIEKLEQSLNFERDERHELEVKVQGIDDREKSLQHRVDRLEDEVRNK
jgi:chaperonin cofactor prefoldin